METKEVKGTIAAVSKPKAWVLKRKDTQAEFTIYSVGIKIDEQWYNFEAKKEEEAQAWIDNNRVKSGIEATITVENKYGAVWKIKSISTGTRPEPDSEAPAIIEERIEDTPAKQDTPTKPVSGDDYMDNIYEIGIAKKNAAIIIGARFGHKTNNWGADERAAYWSLVEELFNEGNIIRKKLCVR